MPRKRRTLLKAAGLALGGGTLASLAGCLDSPVATGGSQPDETPAPEQSTPNDDSKGTPVADLEQWLPDPTKTPLHDGYGVRYYDVAGIRDRQDALHEKAYGRLESEMLGLVPGRDHVDVADVDATLGIGFSTNVALGSFDPKAFGERLASEWNETGTQTGSKTATRTPRDGPERYRGFDLYGDRTVLAVSEDAVLSVSPMGKEDDALELVKAVIDTQADETTHYPDANDYVDAMLGLVDGTHALTCYAEAMDGSTSRGFREDVMTGELKSWRLGAETTHLTFANTYPDAEAAGNADMAAYIESESARFGSYDGLDVKTEDLLVWTEGTTPTSEFDHLSAGGPDDGVHTPNG